MMLREVVMPVVVSALMPVVPVLVFMSIPVPMPVARVPVDGKICRHFELFAVENTVCWSTCCYTCLQRCQWIPPPLLLLPPLVKGL